MTSTCALPDWRLSDADFVQQFRLPKKGIGNLAGDNPFPREDRVKFDEESHTYTIDGIMVPRSVTGLLSIYTNQFDPERAVNIMQNSPGWESKCEDLRQQGIGVHEEDFVHRWERFAEISRIRGHLLHFQCECLANSIPVPEPHSPEFQQAIKNFDVLLALGMTPYRTEVSIFHVGLRCGGQPDLLCKDADERLVIVDWKRTIKISMDNKYTPMKYPLNSLPDCSYFRYALQVNLYRFILESEYSMSVGRMFIAVCHPDAYVPRLIEVPPLDAEVSALVDNEIRQGRADTACTLGT